MNTKELLEGLNKIFLDSTRAVFQELKLIDQRLTALEGKQNQFPDVGKVVETDISDLICQQNDKNPTYQNEDAKAKVLAVLKSCLVQTESNWCGYALLSDFTIPELAEEIVAALNEK